MSAAKEAAEQARGAFIQAKDGLVHALTTTPDDRVNWSPSDTARSPLRVAGHAAIAVGSMLGNLKGDTFAIPNSTEAERFFRESDARFKSREEVIELLDSNGQAYQSWLDELTEERLDSPMVLPFGMGTIPVSLGITFMALHLQWHTAQINYIQTIYGDHDWHLGF